MVVCCWQGLEGMAARSSRTLRTLIELRTSLVGAGGAECPVAHDEAGQGGTGAHPRRPRDRAGPARARPEHRHGVGGVEARRSPTLRPVTASPTSATFGFWQTR